LSNLVARGGGAAYTYQDYTDPNQDQMRLATFYDGTNQYNYLYDANGNPVSVSKGAGWKFSSLSFDNLNHLRQIVYSQTDNYWYNAAGKRVKKTENTLGAYKTTYTMFDGENPLLQEIYTSSGRVQTIFNIIVDGKILAQYKMVYPSTQSTVYFYLDNLNSRRVVLSTAPAVIDRFRYSAWGVPTQDFGSDPYGSFTGKDYDATGLIYFNARYYDPTTGRFLTEDPSRKGVNWYAYCENDPINKTDPTGKVPVDKALDMALRAPVPGVGIAGAGGLNQPGAPALALEFLKANRPGGFSIAVGLVGSAGTGSGANVGVGAVYAHNATGGHLGAYLTLGGGGYGGSGASVSLQAAVSSNPTIQSFAGPSGTVGWSAGEVIVAGNELSIPRTGGSPYAAISLGFGVRTPIPVEMHGFVNQTWVWGK
jgi:RHS repeat-associated protein